MPPQRQTIYITDEDRAALFRLITSRQPPYQEVSSLVNLKGELERALVVGVADLPPTIVTLGSRVLLQEMDSGVIGEYTLVMPGRADITQGFISVLAPVGTALLGQSEGDVVEWIVPAGRRRFRIESVLYQPQADRHAERWTAA